MRPDDADVLLDSDYQPDADVTDIDDRPVIDGGCHTCDGDLLLLGVVDQNGRIEQTGICQTCRRRGQGMATFVTVTGHGTPGQLSRLGQRQRSATAQSTASAAAFLDGSVPAGRYQVRRVNPDVVVITWADDVDMDFTPRRRLSRRLRDAGAWYVHSFPDRIRLLDRDYKDGPGDEIVSRATVPNPRP